MMNRWVILHRRPASLHRPIESWSIDFTSFKDFALLDCCLFFPSSPMPLGPARAFQSVDFEPSAVAPRPLPVSLPVCAGSPTCRDDRPLFCFSFDAEKIDRFFHLFFSTTSLGPNHREALSKLGRGKKVNATFPLRTFPIFCPPKEASPKIDT